MDRIIIKRAYDIREDDEVKEPIKMESDYPGDIHKDVEKKKKTDMRKRQPYLMSKDEDSVNRIDNNDIQDYHDYERMFQNEPMVG
jgi:hypothetical protein